MQARLADADIYLGESTSLELRINGIRNPEPPDWTHPDIDITKAGGQSFNNSSYTMINGQIRQTEEFGYVDDQKATGVFRTEAPFQVEVNLDRLV